MRVEPPSRRVDIDWLRIFACYLLFLFHGALVFAPTPFYHVQNAESSLVFAVLVGFISLWHMPLFFLLAGWSAFQSLSSRGARGFGAERVAKLALPLIAICALFGPLIKFFELRGGFDANYLGLHASPFWVERYRTLVGAELPLMRPFDESFLSFWPSYFTHLERFTWSHLWFVAYLFVFSLLYLPLMLRIVRSRLRIARVGALWVFVPIVPLAVIQVTLRPHYPGLQTLWNDWANFAYYSVYLLLGFAMARFPAWEQALQRQWRRALLAALATMLFLLGSVLGLVHSQPLILAGTAIAGWCFVVALLGFASERLASSTRGLPALSESAYPVYLLHQPAIVLVAVLLIPLSMSPWLKFVLLLAGSVSLTLVVYHVLVQRIGLLRRLHGMKPRSARPAEGVRMRPGVLVAGAER